MRVRASPRRRWRAWASRSRPCAARSRRSSDRASRPVRAHPVHAAAKKVFELSLREALQLGHNYIGTEHILLGLIREGEGVAAQVLVSSAPTSTGSGSRSSSAVRLPGQGRLARGVACPRARRRRRWSSISSAATSPSGRRGGQSGPGHRGREGDRAGDAGPLLPDKNNPVPISEPGVGKTAVVEGLSQAIVKGEVPETLKDKQLYTLDLGALVAGSATAVTSRSG